MAAEPTSTSKLSMQATSFTARAVMPPVLGWAAGLSNRSQMLQLRVIFSAALHWGAQDGRASFGGQSRFEDLPGTWITELAKTPETNVRVPGQ
eukprot:1538990-Pyramimonas_sp.AAC.1